MGISKKNISELADLLLDYCLKVEKGDKVYIMTESVQAFAFFREVRKKIIKRGAFPFEHFVFDSQVGYEGIDKDWISYASEEQISYCSDIKLYEMNNIDKYLRIESGGGDLYDTSNVDSKKISVRQKNTKDIFNARVKKDWLITAFPTKDLAEKTVVDKKKLEEIFLNSTINTDFDELRKKNRKIVEKFKDVDTIKIKGKNVDLSMSIKGRWGVADNGEENMPGGEVYFTPHKESLSGHIKFSYPLTIKQSKARGVYFEFGENGKIVDYSAEENEDLLENTLNIDEGVKYIGELGIGTNPGVTEFCDELLFDEKIVDTIHLAIGKGYQECAPEDEQVNQSAVHHDIVKEATPSMKIIADDDIVYENNEWNF